MVAYSYNSNTPEAEVGTYHKFEDILGYIVGPGHQVINIETESSSGTLPS